MSKRDTKEQIMQISKEIIIKFIETGRVSPNSFPDTFRTIYQSVNNTVIEHINSDTHSPNNSTAKQEFQIHNSKNKN